MNCKYCNKPSKKEFCSASHKHLAKLEPIKIKDSRKKYDETFPECQICGLRGKEIISHIWNRHQSPIKEYKKQFPGFPVRSKEMLKEQSERIKGVKNPAWKHNGKFSVLSKNYVNGFSEKQKKETFSKISKGNRENGNNPTTISYWMKKGFTEEEAIKKRSERQITFSLDICQEKHGKEKGLEIWRNRQLKWHNSYKKSNFSKISQELFWNIPVNNYNDVYFATLSETKEKDESGKNYELRLKLKDKIILPDFIDIKQKKIIEFDGSFFHPENKKHLELERDRSIKASGYKVLHIKEIDYKQNPKETISLCLNYLTQ